MTMANLIKEFPHGVSIMRTQGKWHIEIRGVYGAKNCVRESFPSETELLELLRGFDNTQAA